jgi:hypothetical protein
MFFGSIEHEIVSEIAKIVNGEDGKPAETNMEPVNWDRLAYLRQHEMTEFVANDPGRNPVQMLIWQAGNVLVAAGQKMMHAGNQMLDGQNAAAQIVSEDC